MALHTTRTAFAAAVALGVAMATTGALAHGHGGGGGGHGHAGGGHAFAGHALAARAGGVAMMAHVSAQPFVGQVFAPHALRNQSFGHLASLHHDQFHQRHVHRRVFFTGVGQVFYDWPYDDGSCRVLTARGWVWVC